MVQPPTDDNQAAYRIAYPVDSGTRACCQGIGRHTPDCSADIADPVRLDVPLLLDQTTNMVDLARADANKALRMLPADAPLFAVVDLVAALGHLRQAAVLIDRAADQLDTTARGVEVRR
jgi:hypothetical protein